MATYTYKLICGAGINSYSFNYVSSTSGTKSVTVNSKTTYTVLNDVSTTRTPTISNINKSISGTAYCYSNLSGNNSPYALDFNIESDNTLSAWGNRIAEVHTNGYLAIRAKLYNIGEISLSSFKLKNNSSGASWTINNSTSWLVIEYYKSSGSSLSIIDVVPAESYTSPYTAYGNTKSNEDAYAQSWDVGTDNALDVSYPRWLSIKGTKYQIYVTIPTVTNTSILWTGSLVSPNISYDSSKSTISGTPSATAIGNYSVTFTLKSTLYKWTDGTTAAKTFYWSIIRARTAAVTTTNYTFNGTERVGATFAYCTHNSGTARATNAGTYTVYATPDGNHAWSDGTYLLKSFTWYIYRLNTANASSVTGLVYNGREQTGVSGANVTWTGYTARTNAGSYTAYATPTSNYAWSDGTYALRTINWEIAKKSIAIPTLSTTSYLYTGSTIYPAFSYDSNYVTSSGTSGTNAGNYTAKFNLIETTNLKWTDNTTAQKTIAWTITKASGYVSVSPTALTITYPNSSTGSMTISSHGGSYTLTYYDGVDVVNRSISGNTISFQCNGNTGRGRYKLVSAATTNYTEATVYFYITVNAGTTTVTFIHKYSNTTLETTTSTETYGSTITLANYKEDYTEYNYSYAEDSRGTTVVTAVVGVSPTFTLFYIKKKFNYTIIYDANGGTGSMSPTVINSDADTVRIDFSANQFSYLGKAWKEWFYYAPSRTVGSYYVFHRNASVGNQQLTVYAEWEDAYRYKVYISDGNQWVKARPYISNGNNWVECLPYVSDGSGWK